MALNIQDTSYAGTFASYFWLPATFGMDSVQKGIVHVEDGIKKQHTIGRIDFLNPLQPRQATPTSAGTFTIDGRTLIPQDMSSYVEFNPRDFESHWLAEQLSPTLLARELPVTAENYMVQLVLNRIFEQVELGIWQASTSYQGKYAYGDAKFQLQFFDGFMKLFLNDGNVYKIANPLPLTEAATGGGKKNIAEAFDALLSSVSANKKALLSRPTRYQRLRFLVSINTEQIYHTFLTTSQTYKGVNTTEKGINLYKGYEVVPVAGMPDDTIVFCEALDDVSSNLYVGMNSTEDNNIQLMRLQNNSELFFFKGLMKMAVQYGFSDQTFLYTTQTANDYV